MKTTTAIILSLRLLGCARAATGLPHKRATLDKTIVVTAQVALEFRQAPGTYKMRMPDGEWVAAPAPMRATGKINVEFVHDGKEISLPWKGDLPPRKLYRHARATVLVREKRGQTTYTIIKIECDKQTIYERNEKALNQSLQGTP